MNASISRWLGTVTVLVLSLTTSPTLAHSPVASHVTVMPIRASAHLVGVPPIVQTLNNCGPASITAVLHYWGIARTQQQVQDVVRADGSPRGMAPFGVPGYMRTLGMRGLLGVTGTQRMIKVLISNGFPIIVSQMVSPTYQVRHYRPIVAYDDRQGVFVSNDPYLGAGHQISYADFARIWSSSHQRFLVLYPPSRQSQLDGVLASAGWGRLRAYRADLAWQQNRLKHTPSGEAGYFARYYGYAGVAWDQMELGSFAAAQQTLRTAAGRGASTIVLGWIRAEIRWRSTHPRA